MYKFYPQKTNGELRKTPLTADSALEIAKEISSYYQYYQYEFFNGFEKIKEYKYKFIVRKEEKTIEDLKNLVLQNWETLKEEYNKAFNDIKNKKQKKLDEQIDKLNDKQKELFALLHGNLSYSSYDEYSDKSYINYPLLFGISLEPIKVLVSEMETLFPKYHVYKEYEKLLFNKN